jgi:hypothetical protein
MKEINHFKFIILGESMVMFVAMQPSKLGEVQQFSSLAVILQAQSKTLRSAWHAEDLTPPTSLKSATTVWGSLFAVHLKKSMSIWVVCCSATVIQRDLN